MNAGVIALGLGLAVLAAVAFGPDVRHRLEQRRQRRPHGPRRPMYDPGRERRAELKARELLRSVVGEEAFAMYQDLGFIRVRPGRDGRGLRLPALPAPLDRRLRRAQRPPPQRVLRRLPRRQRSRAPAAGCPTPTTCSPSGWRCRATSTG